MSAVSRKFIVKTCLFTFFIFLIAAALFSTVLKTFYFTAFTYQLLLIATVTTLGHLWVIRASAQNTIKFTTAFMGSATLKLMVYLFFMLIYLWFDRSHVIPFVLTFMILYLIFTVFEVLEVLRFIKK
jgi:hypothetical protein